MPSDAVKMLVQTFISRHPDYCNSLFYDIPNGVMTRLQSAQNAAACLVSGTPRHGHITLLLHQLHRLPVLKRANFKMATLVYRSLAGMAPVYLASECQLMSEEVVIGRVLPIRGLA